MVACLLICVCFGCISTVFERSRWWFGCPRCAIFIFGPFSNPTGFKLEPVCLKISKLVHWLSPVLLHMYVCGGVRLDLVQMYRRFHPAAEPALLMFFGLFFFCSWVGYYIYYIIFNPACSRKQGPGSS